MKILQCISPPPPRWTRSNTRTPSRVWLPSSSFAEGWRRGAARSSPRCCCRAEPTCARSFSNGFCPGSSAAGQPRGSGNPRTRSGAGPNEETWTLIYSGFY